MNMACLLPNTAIRVTLWYPHPCGGYYVVADDCYGPQGNIGWYMDATMLAKHLESVL